MGRTHTKKAPRTAQHPTARSSTLNDRTLSAAFAYFRKNPRTKTVSHGAIRAHFLAQELKHPGQAKYKYNVKKVKAAKEHLEDEEILVKVDRGHTLALGDGVKDGIKALRTSNGNDSSDDERAATAFLAKKHRGEVVSAPKQKQQSSAKPRASTSTATTTKSKPAPSKKRARLSAKPATTSDSDSDARIVVRAPKKPRKSQPTNKKGKAVAVPDDESEDDLTELDELASDVDDASALRLLSKAQLQKRAEEAEAALEAMKEEVREKDNEKEQLQRDLGKLADGYRKLQAQLAAPEGDAADDDEEEEDLGGHEDFNWPEAPNGLDDAVGPALITADHEESLGGHEDFEDDERHFGDMEDSTFYDREVSIAPSDLDLSAAIDVGDASTSSPLLKKLKSHATAVPTSSTKLQRTQSKHQLAEKSSKQHSWASIHPPSPASSRGGSPIQPQQQEVPSSSSQPHYHISHVDSLSRRPSQLPSPDLSSSPIKAPVAPHEDDDGGLELADTILDFGEFDDAQGLENRRLESEIEHLKIQLKERDGELREKAFQVGQGDKSLQLVQSEMNDIVCHFQHLESTTSADATAFGTALLSLNHRLSSTSAALKASQHLSIPKATTSTPTSTLPLPILTDVSISTTPPSQTTLSTMTDPLPTLTSAATNTEGHFAPIPMIHLETSIDGPTLVDAATETGVDPELVSVRQDLGAFQDRFQVAMQRLEAAQREIVDLRQEKDALVERGTQKDLVIERLQGDVRGLEATNAQLEKAAKEKATARTEVEAQLQAELTRSANLLHELDSSTSLYRSLSIDLSASKDSCSTLTTLLAHSKTLTSLLSFHLSTSREHLSRESNEKVALLDTQARLEAELADEVKEHANFLQQHTTFVEDVCVANGEVLKAIGGEFEMEKGIAGQLGEVVRKVEAWASAKESELRQLRSDLDSQESQVVEAAGELRRFSSLPIFAKHQAV
ncbi:hypothetical protein RQP46_005354 [Phenoliferia psychrophenolica]